MSEQPQTPAAEAASTNGDEPTQAVARRPDRTPLIRRDPVALAQHFAKSGYFKDAREMSQAVVKIVAGEELGLGPMASMQGIHIIDGKPSHSANVLATLVKRSEKYAYKVVRSDDEVCELEFFEDGESEGIAKFTLDRAKKMQVKEYGEWKALADTRRWLNSPEDMLFARTISRGVRKFAPDVTAGTPAYTPEELGAEVNDEGEPIYVESQVQHADAPAEAAPTGLAPDLVEHLVKGFELAGSELGGVTPLDGLNLLLGSLGIDAFEPADDLRPQFAALTPEHADALDAELQKALDTDAGEVADAEVVEPEQEGGGEDAGA
jgi:hypothetical protein